MKALVIIACAMLVACSGEGADKEWEEVGNSSAVREVMVNGTRCIVYDGLKSGGITCDWKR